ncbi:hypothetical protein B0H13DRAFT_684966 [Mycena leptocephala]|nr:hypothetical protein B0H13DRAFT_684966 [Mycena leptocephala]
MPCNSALSQYLAQEKHRRLLKRLRETPYCLLSLSDYGRDFVSAIRCRPSAGQSVDFLWPHLQTEFEGVLVGTVHSCSGLDSIHVELVVPPSSLPEMATFFNEQLQCLTAAFFKREQSAALGVILEDVIPWCSGPTLGDEQNNGRQISLSIPAEATVRLNTPTRAFSTTSAVSSTSSSATLDDDPPCPAQRLFPSEGDLVIALCSLHARDFPRPSIRGQPTFIRVYTLTASRVEIIV